MKFSMHDNEAVPRLRDECGLFFFIIILTHCSLESPKRVFGPNMDSDQGLH